MNARLFSFAVTHICINECKMALFMCLIGIYYNRGVICKIVILFYLFEPLCEKTSFTIYKPQRHRPNCTSIQSKQCHKCKFIG